MTPAEKRHAEKANTLLVEAARAIDRTKSGQSGAAAKLIRQANLEKQKAGLIRGKLVT
jgi:hypothetical protein